MQRRIAEKRRLRRAAKRSELAGGGRNVEKSSHVTGDVSTEAQLELLLDDGEQGKGDFDMRALVRQEKEREKINGGKKEKRKKKQKKK